MHRYLLSIVIPTKDRYETLLPVLNSLLAINGESLEIIVQDNSLNNTPILEFVELKKNNSSFKYYYSSNKLSIIENADLAIKNSSGEYVCFIGDDDGVMPYIVELTRWMASNNIRALKAFKPSYYWPKQKSNYLSKNSSGVLKCQRYNYSIKTISAKKGLMHVLQTGGTSMKRLPCVYHGIIRKDILDLIYLRCNSYFPGPSPDMANAIALVHFLDEYTYVDFPVVISGKSIKSTGGQGVLHKHIARIEDVVHLPQDTVRNWSERIPKYWTSQTIWAESVLKSLDKFADYTNQKKLKYSYLYATIVAFNPKLKNVIFSNFKYSIYTLGFFANYIKIFFLRLKNFIKNKISNSFSNITDISKAIETLNKDLDIEKIQKLINNIK